MSSPLAPELQLRPVCAHEDALLVALAGDGLPPAVADLQRRASERAWAAAWPGLRRSVVVVDGVAVGRLYVGWSVSEVRIVDVTLLPGFRGRGLGTALLRGVLAEATGRRVSLAVEAASPARRLYERLGFVATGAPDPVRVEMEWRA